MDIEKVELLMKKMLSEQEERFEKIMNEMFDKQIGKLCERLDKIENNITSNKNDIKNIQKELNDVKRSIEFNEDLFDKKIAEVHGRIDSILDEKEELEEKMSDLEDRKRRNNLRVDGIKEHEGETEEQLEEKIKNIIKEKLEIEDDIEIERIHRTGRYNRTKRDKPRTIIFKLLRYKDKTKILRNGRKLKGTNIWINEDFSKRTLNIRKNLLAEIKQRRNNGEEGLYLNYLTIRKFKKRQPVSDYDDNNDNNSNSEQNSSNNNSSNNDNNGNNDTNGTE